MSAPAALALLGALGSGFLVCRRRWVWSLGRYGQALAPAFLLSAWFAFLSLGEWTRSLTLMGALACLALLALAALAWRTKPCRRRFFPWSGLDWAAFSLLAACILSFDGHDSICHTAVVSTYLRGNIPPCAFNDPSFPLIYHSLFDAAAALVVKALDIDIELGLHLVSLACLFAVMCALKALSRILFKDRLARKLARLFFLLGFGPVYLHRGWWGFPLRVLLHGQSAQSFAEAILRRPMGLNYVVFLLFLAAILRGLSRPRLWLLPCAYLVPKTSEELTLLALALALLLALRGQLSLRWAAAWGILLLAAALPSGVFHAMASSSAPSLAPKLSLVWPPSLPYWLDQQAGLALFSRKGLAQLLLEWGPLFFAGLALSLRDEKRRVLVAVFVLGFLAAAGLGLGPWPKADLDRLLFYGTSCGFMLQAGLIERMRRWPRPAFLAGTALLAAGTVLGPLGYVATFLRPNDPPGKIAKTALGKLRRREPLEAVFAPVGPKEQVLSDALTAQELVSAGIVVVAPMRARFVGQVDKDAFDAYVKRRPRRPDWMFLPAGDPRLAKAQEFSRHQGYVLARPLAL